MAEKIKYPQYRKYLHGRTFFKIISDTSWEEIENIGGNYILNEFNVKIMPDRNYLSDMTFDYQNNWLKIEEEENEKIKKHLAE